MDFGGGVRDGLLGATVKVAAVLLSCLAASGTTAQSDPLAPREFLAPPHFDGFAHFTYSSKITSDEPRHTTVEYAVCNLHSEPLIYSWHGPNVKLGRGGRLPNEHCDIVRRSLCGVVHDYNASIRYTQASRPLSAAAHVSPPLCNITVRELITFLKRLLPGDEWTTPTRAVLELEVTQTLSDAGVQHVVRWYPPTVSLILDAGAFPKQEVETVAASLNEAGYETRTAVLWELLPSESWESVSSARLFEPVIELRQSAAGEGVTIVTSGQPNSIVTSTVSAIDAETGLLLDIEISTFGE